MRMPHTVHGSPFAVSLFYMMQALQTLHITCAARPMLCTITGSHVVHDQSAPIVLSWHHVHQAPC